MTAPASNTPNAIIADAFVDACLIQRGDVLNGEQLADGMRRLIDVINVEGTQGLKLWANIDTTVPLTAGTATYTMAPSGSVDMTKPLRVMEAYYLYTATNTRRPITPMALRDYWQLGQAGTLTSNRGTISQYVVNKFQTSLSVTFWLCPDTTEAANGAVHLLLQTQLTNVTELDETVNFPIEWRMFLRWALAEELSSGQPEAVQQRCMMSAQKYRDLLEGWDVEDASTTMAVDQRMSYSKGSFR